MSETAAAPPVGQSGKHLAPRSFQSPATPGSKQTLHQVRACSARLAHVPTEQPTPGAPTGSHPPAPARPAPIPLARSGEQKTAARISHCTIEPVRTSYLTSGPESDPIPDVRFLRRSRRCDDVRWEGASPNNPASRTLVLSCPSCRWRQNNESPWRLWR